MAAPSQADVNRQAAINAGIVALAAHQTAGLWPQVDWASPAAATAVRTIFGGIVDQFGQSAAAVAAQFYDEQRAQAAPPTSYTATMADPLSPVMLDKIVTSAFLGGQPTADIPESAQTTSNLPVEQRVPDRLDGQLQRLVLQPGRETIADNASADPAGVRYVRVPSGDRTCAFCVMMASRDIAEVQGKTINMKYLSAHSAQFRDSDGKKYHDHCDCQPVPVFPGMSVEDVSPNIADYQRMYYKATADAGTHSDARKILASMRKLHGLR